MFEKVTAYALIGVAIIALLICSVATMADPMGRSRPWDLAVIWYPGLIMLAAGIAILAARRAGLLACAVAAMTLGMLGLATPAFAADGGVVVPWGQWVADGLGYALEIAGLWLVWALRAWIPDTLRQYIVNEVLKNATHFAVAVTPGAVAGQSVSLPQTTSLVANFESYVIQNAPGIARWLGDTLRTKAIARLSAAGMLPADFDPAKV